MAKTSLTLRRVAPPLLLGAGVVLASVAEIPDLRPPTVTSLPSGSGALASPAVTDGTRITDGMLRFTAEVSDDSGVPTPPVLTLDGILLDGQVTYPEAGDGDGTGSGWQVLYSGVVPDGRHLLALRATDGAGNAGTTTFGLDVATPPTITELQPVSYDRVLRPVVSAKVSDANTPVDPRSIALTLDGAPVAHAYDAEAGRVTYVPAADLADESYHTAIVRVADAGGLSATRAWMFHVTTWPDMADSGIDGCTSCHSPVAPPAGSPPVLPWEAVHVATVRFDGELHTAGRSDCWVCHGGSSGAEITTAGYAICGQCHGRPGDWLGYGAGWYHGQHTAIAYRPAVRDAAFPVRIARNREMIDCVVCHQPGVTTLRTTGIPTGSHDIPELHKSSLPESRVACDACHARSLTREHAREGRHDEDGQPIRCGTCHRSVDGSVLGAIATGRTDCLACHPRPAFLAVHHTSNDQAGCRVCHPCAVPQAPSSP